MKLSYPIHGVVYSKSSSWVSTVGSAYGNQREFNTEYGQITARKPHTVLKVLKGEDTKRCGESSFKAEEEGCHICGITGHFWKACKHYNKKYSLEQNSNYFLKKNKRDRDDNVKAGDRVPISRVAIDGFFKIRNFWILLD